MKNSNFLWALIVAVMMAMTGAAYADTQSSDHMAQHASSQTKHEGYGVLKAVNTEAGKLQIAHEAIPSLGWPEMTMWFVLRGSLPNEVKAGDSVRFELEQIQSKAWVITRIERKR